MTTFQVPERDELRQMNRLELTAFCKDVRTFLVDKISKKGGHLASNLGMVEVEVALWRAFDFPNDKVIFDVGHQCYTYKLLSGRQKGFDTLREFGGMAGFPKRHESEYDSFDTGHSSTSLSAGLGYCAARDLLGEKYRVVSVIGDGALTGGEAYEALNNAANLKTGFIMVLNDNEMSISRNVGGVSKCLTDIRSSAGYNKMKTGVKNALSGSQYGQNLIRRIDNTKDSLKEIVMPSGMIFENLGIKYLGPVDGHDVPQMEKIFKRAIAMDRPVVVHLVTKKGRGYEFAEKRPSIYHGVGSFDPSLGVQKNPDAQKTYGEVLGDFMMDAMQKHPEIALVTAAMGDNLGLRKVAKQYPKRFFDVGIAEQHAVTFSAGLAAGGMHAYFPVYSSFLQRGIDQVITDVCLQNLNVCFLVDRAGLVGKDGETHQGAFDLQLLSAIPNMTVLSPRNGGEFLSMLRFSLDFQGPLAIRYPRGGAGDLSEQSFKLSQAELLKVAPGNRFRVSLVSVGNMSDTAMEVAERLSKEDIFTYVYDLRTAYPFDENCIKECMVNSQLIVTLEDGVKTGGIGEHIAAYVAEHGKNPLTVSRVISVAIPEQFVPQGSISELRKELKMDVDSITDRIKKALEISQ